MDQIISVVTPSFNQVEYIDDAILSVLSQQGNFYIDYVIIDGLSNDGSVKRIEWYEKELKKKCRVKRHKDLNFYVSDECIHINRCKGISYRWFSEKDQGHGDALNKGFAKTKGEIMCWLNSDDIFLNDAFAIITDIYYQFDHVKWTTALNVIINKDGSRAPITHLGKHNYKNIFSFLTNDYEFIQQEATFWRRELWQKAGSFINTQYKLMVDGELWCRFFLHEPIYHINREIGAYRLHDSNRAHKYMFEVKAEMRRAVLSMGEKVPSVIRDVANNIIENAPMIDADHKNLNYMIIDKDGRDSPWIIREVDFFLYSSKRHTYKYRTLSKELKELNNRYKNEIVKFTQSLSEKDFIIEDLNKKLDDKNKLITHNNSLIETKQRRLDEKDSMIREQVDMIKQFLQQIKQNNADLQQQKIQLDQYGEKVGEIKSLQLNQARLLTETNNRIEKYQKIITGLNKTISELNEELQIKDIEVEKLRKNMLEINNELDESKRLMNEELQIKDIEVEKLRKNVLEINNELDESKRLMNEELQIKEIEVEKLRKNVLEINNELDERNRTLADLQHLLMQLEKHKQKQTILIKEYKDLLHNVERSYSLRLGKALLYPAKQIRNLLNL